jgi:hypothetical protein
MRSLLVAVTVFLGASSVEAQTVSRYTILFHGKESGHQTTRIAEGGKFSVDFSYRDNGRGPDLKEEFSIAADGILRSYTAVRSVNLVMKDGVVYYPSEIYEAMGIKPFVKPITPEAAKK